MLRVEDAFVYGVLAPISHVQVWQTTANLVGVW